MTDLEHELVSEVVADGRDDTDGSSFGRRLAIVTALGVVWQLVFILGYQRDFYVWGDSYFYHEAGQLLADGFGWINPLLYEETGIQDQVADHPPMYILFIALVTSAGFRSPVAHMLATTVVFGAAVIAASGILGRLVAGARAGLIAAALVGVYPGVWGWHGTILSEPTAMLGVCLFLIATYRYLEQPSWQRAAWIGAAITFAVYGRAELLLLSVVVVVPLLLRRRELAVGTRWQHLVVAGATCVATLAPWVAFNLSRFDETVLISEGFQVTLATANCDLTYYGQGTGYWNIACATDYAAAEGLTLANSTQPERSEAMLNGATAYIGDNVDRIPTVLVARWTRILSLWKPLEQARFDGATEARHLWVTHSAHLSFFPIAAAAAAGLVMLRRRRVPILPLAGSLLVVLITVTITFGQARYRASVEPVLAVLAAVAVDRLVGWWQRALSDGERRQHRVADDA